MARHAQSMSPWLMFMYRFLTSRLPQRSTLYPGSRLLQLAQVRFLPAAPTKPRTHTRQNSDDLIEDLEHHLGDTTTEYLQVRVTYHHSGFPQKQGETTAAVMPNGIASIQTTIQTTAVAAIKCHNSASPWSPYPGAPQPNPLFEIIASHWGPVSARKAMQRVARSRSIRHKSSLIPRSLSELLALSGEASWSVRGREDGGTETREEKRTVKPKQMSSEEAAPRTPMPPARTAPPIPKRKASLRHVLDSSPTTQQQTPDYEADPKGDPTWTKLRQTPGEAPKSTTGTSYGSVASRRSYRPGRIRKASSAFYAYSSPTAPVSSPPTTPVRNLSLIHI